MEIRLLYMVFGSEKEAASLGREFVEKKLVACVNILPGVQSLYWWKGAVVKDNEVVMIAKTTQKNIAKIENLLKTRHSYECPCLLSLKVDSGLPAYLKWVIEETQTP